MNALVTSVILRHVRELFPVQRTGRPATPPETALEYMMVMLRSMAHARYDAVSRQLSNDPPYVSKMDASRSLRPGVPLAA